MSALDEEQDVGRRSAVLAAAARVHGRVVRARKDPAEFIELCWPGEDGAPFELAPFHRTWLSSLEESDRLIIESFKGSAKTSIVGAYLVWLLGRNPNLRIKLIANSDQRARDRLYVMRRAIENNPMVRAVFPELRFARDGEVTKHRLYVERSARSKDPSVEAGGVTSTIVGARADVLVFDDVCDLRNTVLYPQLREKVNEKIRTEWLPLLDRGGRIIFIGTPYSVNDALAMVKSRKWPHVSSVCGGPPDFLSPWPDRFPSDRLARMYADAGSIDYDRSYRCIALSRDVMPIKPAWIQYYDNEKLGAGVDEYICVQGYDLAISAKGDFFAGATVLYDTSRNLIFVADVWHGHLSFLEQAESIVREFSCWTPQRVGIEAVGYQSALAQYLTEKSPRPLPVVSLHPRGGKDRRLAEVTPLFEQQRIWFHPRLHPQEVDVARGSLVTELLGFGVEAHDDMVDAFLYALQALREFTAQTAPRERGFEVGEGIDARISIV